jgi:hypothetical protein
MTRWLRGTLIATLALAPAALGCASPQRAPDAADLGAAPTSGADLAAASGADLAGQPPPTCDNAGAVCTTGNPGACGPGHIVCSGSVGSCTPDVTTQPCYDGPAASRDVGVCKSGTQSCIGTLGACTGQVLPAARENCFNDADDDCDGKVDDQCPDALTIGAVRPLAAHGGSGGSPGAAVCPPGTWLLKTTMYWDDQDKFVAGLDVWCAAPRLVRGANSYSMGSQTLPSTPSASVLGKNAGNGAGSSDFTCAAAGDVGQWSGVRAGSYVSAFGMFCGSAALTLGSDNRLSVKLTPVGSNQPLGYDHGDPLFADNCADNEVLVGYDVRAGDYLDQVQSVCAPIIVTYK